MQSQPIPRAVSLARGILVAESVLWLPIALLLVIAGINAVATFGGAWADLLGIILLGLAALGLGLVVAGIRSGLGVGRLRAGSRATALQLAALGVVGGVLLASTGWATWLVFGLEIDVDVTDWGAAPEIVSATLGSAFVLGNLVIIWLLTGNRRGRSAFLGSAGEGR